MTAPSPVPSISNHEFSSPFKSEPSSPVAKLNESDSFNGCDRLVTPHTYSQSSSSQSPSSLPSSRSLISPQPLTPSSTDSHVSHEKSPSPNRDKIDLDHSSPKTPTSAADVEPEAVVRKDTKSPSSCEKNGDADVPFEKNGTEPQSRKDDVDESTAVEEPKNDDVVSEVSLWFLLTNVLRFSKFCAGA